MSNLAIIKQAMPEIKKKFESVPNCNLDFAREAGFLIQAMESNTYLQSMSPESIKKVIVNVAMTGLTLNPVLKLAYPVPRKGNLILDVSYMGLINVLVTSGAALKIEADVVKENDFFDFEKGTNPFIKHKPALKDRGEIIAAYAIAYLPNGEKQFEVMEREELEKVKKSSEAAKSGKQSPYDNWESEMFRKAPVKRLFKFLPKHNIPDQVVKTLEIEEQNNGINFEKEKQQASASKASAFFDEEPETSAEVVDDKPEIEAAK